MRSKQRGRINLLTLVLLVGLVVGGYCGVKFIPIYIEKSRVTRLVKQAANMWANVEPDVNRVKSELKYNLETAQVESITVEDVNFSRPTDKEFQVWVDYEVVVEHPNDIVEPTVFEFSVSYTSVRGSPTE